MIWLKNYLNCIEKITELHNCGIEFLFALNFEKTKGFVIPISELEHYPVKYKFNTNEITSYDGTIACRIHSNPCSQDEFKTCFDFVRHNNVIGNSYLCNLTFQTPIEINLNLEQIFHYSKAKYKLFIKDQFTVFSPERFILIKDNKISTNPMKGTIRADIPNAKEILLSNSKERFEHNTIVDLMRNDLSIVAEQVKVDRLQYLELIQTHQNDLYQMSSEISGQVKFEYQNKLGELLNKLLPAGSVSGAPKQKTCEIIAKTENKIRNFYTGIFGTFQNGIVDTAVAIRFIEKIDKQLYFRSGGGITAWSDVESEYQEMKDKIYVPIF